MSKGLIALIDDITAIAKVAAASLDDVATQATKASTKAAGIAIDDAAVTPRYVVGFTADRELPIILRIARGSLVNKLVILLPAALLLGVFAPWLITPLLLIGGAFLCYEGAEKLYEKLYPHAAHAHEGKMAGNTATPQELEEAKVAGAIRTDLILSAEIMAIALSTVSEGSFAMKAMVLAVVGLGLTVLVYGAVAIIVKADDAGLAMAQRGQGAVAAIGRGIVRTMPTFLAFLAGLGTAAMLWVGGDITIHSIKEFGLHAPYEVVKAASAWAGSLVPPVAGIMSWATGATMAGVFGIAIGAVLIPATEHIIAPVARQLRKILPCRLSKQT